MYKGTPLLWSSKFPFVYITISFIAGIISAYHISKDVWYIAHIAFFSLSALYIGLVFWGYKSNRNFSGLGLLSIISIFFAGYISLLNRTPRYDVFHLINNCEDIEAYRAVVIDSPKIKKTVIQVTIEIRQGRVKGVWKPFVGKIKLQSIIDKCPSLKYGDVIIVDRTPKRASVWLNEDMFDYKSFLERKNIYHTHFLRDHDIHVVAYKPPSRTVSWALKTQEWLSEKVKASMADPRSRNIVLALVLGMRKALDSDLQNRYIEAGVVHVFAVSGLHIGLLYMLLMLLLWLLRLRRKYVGKMFTLCILWFYAWITGLSPSVIRAVSMFSLFTISGLFKRRHNSVNTLAISAFLLMLYNPLSIFDIGFQLSYATVLGILWLQPTLYQCLTITHVRIKKIWQLASVSLAAQLFTLPLSLYYFHVFPTYFLLANSIVIPAMPIIIGMALLIIITSPLPGISLFLGKITTYFVTVLNQYIKLICQIPGSQITDIYPSLATTLSLYVIIVSIWFFVRYRRFIYLLISTCMAMIILIHVIYTWQNPQKQWVFYSYPSTKGIAFVKNQKATMIIDYKKNATAYHNTILPHLQKIGVKKVIKQKTDCQASSTYYNYRQKIKLVALQGKKGIWLDNPNVVIPKIKKPLSIDFLWIENNAITCLFSWLTTFKVGCIVIGSTNSPKVCHDLEQQAHIKNIGCIILRKNITCAVKI